MAAYYNEFDPFAAAWLKELIKDGLIADGIVDERSIADVQPEDLRGFTQCHFFAGIGGWSSAARLAGWSDDRPMWSGSPPCQPFSTAGNRKGQDDERHLWPVFFNLIRECAPPVVFGEQVAAAIRTGWFDDLQTDMEAEGYATAMVVLPACSVGAPHKRDRLWYVAERVADTKGVRSDERPAHSEGRGDRVCTKQRPFAIHNSESDYGFVADTNEPRQSSSEGRGEGCGNQAGHNPGRCGSDDRGVADSEGKRNNGGLRPIHFEDERQQACKEQGQDPAQQCGTGSELNSPLADTSNKGLQGYGRSEQVDDSEGWKESVRLSAESSFWGNANTIYCRDGKYRPIPVEPEIFPLANGISNRVGILRGAGNAIVPQVAAEVIGVYMDEVACND